MKNVYVGQEIKINQNTNVIVACENKTGGNQYCLVMDKTSFIETEMFIKREDIVWQTVF